MRVREMIYWINKANLEGSRLEQNLSTIKNIRKYKIAIETLHKVSIFKNEIDWILNCSIYATSLDEIVLKEQEREILLSRTNLLINKIALLRQLENQLFPPLNENTLSVKLPNADDINNLTKSMKSFEKGISLLLSHNSIDGSITVINWEHGSFWLNLSVRTTAAIGIISSGLWAAAVIAKKMDEHKYLEQQVRSMELRNESIEDLVKKQKQFTNQLIDLEANAIIDEHLNSESDFEEKERIKEGIKVLAELIQNGTQVQPSLAAPETVSNLFPDLSDISKITSKVKQIEHKKSE